VAFAQALGVSAGLAFAVAAGTIVMVGPDLASQRLLFAAAAVSATVGAGAAAWWRTPSLQRTGSAMDRRLRLEDRVVAALQLHRTDDVVAALVVSDAVRKLQDAAPEEVFPMRLGWWAAPAVIGAGLLLAATTIGARSAPSTSVPAGSGGSVSRVSRATSDGADAPEPNALPAASATAPAASAQSASASARTDSDHERRRELADDASGRKGGPVESAALSSAAASAPDGSAAGRSGDRSGGTPSGPSVERGPASGNANRSETRAGGVSGAVSVGRTIESTTRASQTTSAAVIAVAKAQAEAALSRGEIPPAYRKHVREYFLAILRTAPGK
jgi:hypothetical protein